MIIGFLTVYLCSQIEKQDFSPKENGSNLTGSDISKDLSASSNTINTISTAISSTFSTSSPFNSSSVKNNINVDDLDIKALLNHGDQITKASNGVRKRCDHHFTTLQPL